MSIQRTSQSFSVKHAVRLVISWRVILTIIALIAPLFVEYRPSFPYADAMLKPLGAKALTAWANFDGVHYLTIIEKGYVGTGSIQAFFPLYPLLVRWVTAGVGHPVLAGIIVSTVALVGAVFFGYQLIALDYKSHVAKKTIILLLLFPTAFFFASLYTESLFLLLVTASLFYARQNRYGWAAVLAALASATRITGILLLPVLLIEYFSTQKPNPKTPTKTIADVLTIGFSTSGLMAFMAYLKSTFADPFLFIHVQSQFGSGRQTDKFIMLYQVFWRYIKMLITVQKDSLVYYTVVGEFCIGLGFLILILYGIKYLRTSYVVYAVLSYLIPTVTGTFTSMPRYVLVIFPAFIVLAKVLKGAAFTVTCLLFGILLIINTILFIQGYWIA